MWVIATLACSGIWAQQTTPIVLDGVEVRGLERVSESLVRSQLEVKAGDTLDFRAVQRDIRRLYPLGYFATISAILNRADGKNVLVYVLEEERIIDEIRIQGNKKIKVRQLRGAIAWHEGQAFVREGYGEERDAILNLYRSKGFLNSTVDIIVEPIAPTRVRVTYQIVEGKKARIKGIDFLGNDALSKRKLQRAVKTRRAYWFIGGRYDEEKFETDLTNILNAYGNVGRLEAEIASTDFLYGKKGKRLDIKIAVVEGPEYSIETLSTAGNTAFSNGELEPRIKSRQGEVHNKGQVTADGQALQKLYSDSGYVNAQVVPQVTLDREAHTTSVTHQIRESELKYIREVRITGNSITKDEVIRRSVQLKPGERYDGNLRELTERRLQQTDYFTSPPRLRIEGENENDRFANVLVDVEEGKTGDFNFGGAFNTDQGFGGFGELRFRNFDITNPPSFSGGGQVFSSRFFLGTRRTNIRVGLTDPEFLGYPFSLGVELFSERFQGSGSSDFTIESTGGSVSIGKRLSTFNTLSLTLLYRDTSIDDLDTFVDPALRELQDPGQTLSVALGVARNTTNSFRDPTRGGDHSVVFEVANFGFDNDFIKFDHESTWFYGLNRWEKVAFSFRTREGIAFPFGDKEFVPLNDRYFAGGSNTLRGYDFRDVGPKAQTFRVENGQVIVDEESVGGELRILNTVEAKYKVNDIIRLYLFGDSGAVFFRPEDINFEDFRFSVGVGVGISVPFLGPLRIDYGYPLNPDGSQGNGQLHLQSSISF